MKELVLDASAALALLVPSQVTEAARSFFASPNGRYVAPPLFRLEVRNALLRLERRALLPVRSRDRELASLEGIVHFSDSPGGLGSMRVMELARENGLGVYDAEYLDLSLQRGAAVVSRDARLLEAASGIGGVTPIDLR